MSRSNATTDVYTAIADPTRRALLQRLGEGEQTVTALAAQFEVTLSAISQHLRILHEVGLVNVRRDGRERIYSLNALPLRPVADWVNRYTYFWQDRLDALETYLDRCVSEQTQEKRTQKEYEEELETEEKGWAENL